MGGDGAYFEENWNGCREESERHRYERNEKQWHGRQMMKMLLSAPYPMYLYTQGSRDPDSDRWMSGSLSMSLCTQPDLANSRP